MHRLAASPAVQLKSVASRYARGTACGIGANRAGGLRRLAGVQAAQQLRIYPLAPTARTPALARLEAVLLLAREPLSTRRLAQWAGLADGTEARTLIRQLQRYYREEQAAITVEEIAGGFQLLTRPQLGSWLRRLYQRPSAARLSAPALETLAVTAYRQPVLRTEIEAIRGVSCGEILRQLLDRDLVRVVGRADELGRPFLYGTSRSFLRVFGLRQLADLPRWEALCRQDALQVIPLKPTA